MKNTSKQYDSIIAICRELYSKKMKDYGSAWRILRLPSLTDQIFIKAQRIRSLQENEVRKVDEDETSEFIGIINYCIMAYSSDKWPCKKFITFLNLVISNKMI